MALETAVGDKDEEEPVAVLGETAEVTRGELVEKDKKLADPAAAAGDGETETCETGEEPSSPDPYYPPIIYLPEVVVNSGEDGEEEIFKRRARLYRYAYECEPPEWKERGTGDVRILKKPSNESARILMRREKTLKVCANHFILPWMNMKPNCGSDKAWVWVTKADFADEEPKQETLALKFGSVENAKLFHEAFERMRNYVLMVEAGRIRETEKVETQEKTEEILEEGGKVETSEKVEEKVSAETDEKFVKTEESDEKKQLAERLADLVVNNQ